MLVVVVVVLVVEMAVSLCRSCGFCYCTGNIEIHCTDMETGCHGGELVTLY